MECERRAPRRGDRAEEGPAHGENKHRCGDTVHQANIEHADADTQAATRGDGAKDCEHYAKIPPSHSEDPFDELRRPDLGSHRCACRAGKGTRHWPRPRRGVGQSVMLLNSRRPRPDRGPAASPPRHDHAIGSPHSAEVPDRRCTRPSAGPSSVSMNQNERRSSTSR